MYGELSYLDVLFQATDIQDFLVRVQYLNTIAEHDQQMVDKLTAAEDKVEAKVEEIDRQEKTLAGYEAKQRELTVTYDAALKEQNDFLAGLESDLELTKQLQAQEEAERAVITANWREKENAYQAELERLAAERRAREEQERQVAIASFNGSFGWPVPSSLTISSHYGGRNHPVYGGWKHHSGVDISAGAGSDIKASESGVVTLSKWYSTYGNCVIISHGGGVQTLYAHASKLLVSEGQTVNKGDVIAKVGSTGVSTGNHLHFEIIINGKDVNPRPYLGY
jgi:murein DD-endopeptidase MepM/ murein hydrolase activator NlpD